MVIAICDDEKKLRSALRRAVEPKLQLTGIEYTIHEYESGEKLLSGMEMHVPDLLFLDIEMSGMNGMETARALRRKYKDTIIIFVTAYPDFVFQGYEVHAFHYILKPYKEEKIREVLEKAFEEIVKKQEKYYLVEQKSGTLRLAFSRVVYFKSEGRSVEAVMLSTHVRNNMGDNFLETVRFYGKLSDIEVQMPSGFLRIHNRYLVNLSFVEKLEGTALVCAGQVLPVSRAYKQETAVAFAKMMLR